jgi:hypothetical protein
MSMALVEMNSPDGTQRLLLYSSLHSCSSFGGRRHYLSRKGTAGGPSQKLPVLRTDAITARAVSFIPRNPTGLIAFNERLYLG